MLCCLRPVTKEPEKEQEEREQDKRPSENEEVKEAVITVQTEDTEDLAAAVICQVNEGPESPRGKQVNATDHDVMAEDGSALQGTSSEAREPSMPTEIHAAPSPPNQHVSNPHPPNMLGGVGGPVATSPVLEEAGASGKSEAVAVTASAVQAGGTADPDPPQLAQLENSAANLPTPAPSPAAATPTPTRASSLQTTPSSSRARLGSSRLSAGNGTPVGGHPSPVAAPRSAGRGAASAPALTIPSQPASRSAAQRAGPKLVLMSPKTLADSITPEQHLRLSSSARRQQGSDFSGGRSLQHQVSEPAFVSIYNTGGGRNTYRAGAAGGPAGDFRGGLSRSAAFALSSMDRSTKTVQSIDFRPRWR